MKLDKVAIEKLILDVEVDLESEGPALDADEKSAIRENILAVLQNYFRYMGASSKDETFESLAESREALYQIYITAQKTRQDLNLITRPENKELAEVLDMFLRHTRVQAEAVFGEMN